MNRKEFIKACGAICVGGTAVSALFQSCASNNYFAKTTLANNVISVSKAEFITIQNNKNVNRKYVLIRTERFNFPICIYKISEENYTALLMECTHKSCELQPQGEYLVCPCHGSEFNNKGVVQNPPAEQNLKTFKINTDNEYIYLQL